MDSSDSIAAFNALVDSPPKTHHVAREIRCFPTLDSTNTFVLEQGHDGLLVIADQQTAGRGRQQRNWHSAPGMGLWFTVCLDGLVQGLTFAAALAVRKALIAQCPVTVKWPNDILLDAKKICGILVEHKHGRMALGIGLNVHQRMDDFPEDLREGAGSLDSLTDRSWDRVTILRAILEQLDGYVALLKQGDLETVRAEWAEACSVVGKRVEIGAVAGEVIEIDAIGALVVKTDAGTERILSGDLALIDGDDE